MLNVLYSIIEVVYQINIDEGKRWDVVENHYESISPTAGRVPIYCGSLEDAGDKSLRGVYN